MKTPLHTFAHLYELPEAAVRDSCKLHDLKQQKFILAQFWRPEVRNYGISRAMLSPKALGNHLFLLPPASGGCRCSLACGHIAPLSASMVPWPPPLLCVSHEDTGHCI